MIRITDKSWKRLERTVARKLKTTRNPLSGRASGHNTSSDTLHPLLYVECKYKTKIPFVKEFWDKTIEARKEGKIPMLVFKEKYQSDELVIIRLNDFRRMIHYGYFGTGTVPK